MEAIALRRWHIALHHDGPRSDPNDRLGVVMGETADGRVFRDRVIDKVLGGRTFRSRGGQVFRLEGEPRPEFIEEMAIRWNDAIVWDHPLTRSAGPLRMMVTVGCFKPYDDPAAVAFQASCDWNNLRPWR